MPIKLQAQPPVNNRSPEGRSPSGQTGKIMRHGSSFKEIFAKKAKALPARNNRQQPSRLPGNICESPVDARRETGYFLLSN